MQFYSKALELMDSAAMTLITPSLWTNGTALYVVRSGFHRPFGDIQALQSTKTIRAKPLQLDQASDRSSIDPDQGRLPRSCFSMEYQPLRPQSQPHPALPAGPRHRRRRMTQPKDRFQCGVVILHGSYVIESLSARSSSDEERLSVPPKQLWILL